MTAGRGVVHSEMPGGDSGENVGLQLWVNLKSTDKVFRHSGFCHGIILLL